MSDVAMNVSSAPAPSGTNTPPAGASGLKSTGTHQSTPDQANTSATRAAPSNEGVPTSPGTNETFEVKVNGRTVRMTRDELINHASMSHAAQERFKEAARMRKEVETLRETMKKNPLQALMDPNSGLTKEQLRQHMEDWYHREFIESERLTEDQRRLRDTEAQLNRYKEQEARSQKEAQENEFRQKTEQESAGLQQQLMEAMDKSGLPRTRAIMSRVVFHLKNNLMNGWDAPLDFVIKQVEEEHMSNLQQALFEAPIEKVIERIGPDLMKKIRQYDLDQLRKRRQGVGGLDTGYGAPESSTPKTEKIYMHDVEKRLKEMRMGR